MAFLNSSLYQFLYSKLFGEVKIVKGTMGAIPEITRESDELTALVDQVLSGDNSKQEVIETIFFI